MVAHTQQVRAALGQLYGGVAEAESQQRNFLLTNNRRYLEDSRRQAAEAGTEAYILATLVRDNPAQAERVEQLQRVTGERMRTLENTVAAFNQSGLPAAQEMIRESRGLELQKAIQTLVSQMNQEEETLLRSREARAAREQSKTLVSLLITLAVAAVGFMVLFRRIRREMTRRTRAQQLLRESEENLQVTLHSIGDAVLATDTEGRVTRMNPIAENLTGWTQAEALGKPVDEIFNIIHEETREPALIPVSSVLATGEIQGLANHTVVIARDGKESPIADSAAPIRDKDGRILGVVLVFRDVTAEHAAETALRESEARYRSLFESIDEGFCIIEMIFDGEGKPADFRFLEINPSFEKQTGLQDALGKRMLELAPQHEAHWFETFGQIVLTGEPARFQNRAEQLKRTYDVYAFRLGDPSLRQVAILFNDITHSREAEARIVKLNADLQARAAELEEANKELEAFSYSVSHDLRAPLRHVNGYVTMLAEDNQSRFSEDGLRYLKVITDASAQMGQLIDDLLAFSRMGRTGMRRDPVRLDELVENTVRDLEMITTGRRIDWKIHSLPRVTGDASMLRQVFANLLGNAVKYTRHRDPAEIEIGCAGEENGRSILFVRDNGAGFDMKYVHKLFGVFQRLHRAEDFEGTGIGLALVGRIVVRHGGRTWAEGKLNEGATFYFTLPPAP
jgi:PAS domain S-box-containing protein